MKKHSLLLFCCLCWSYAKAMTLEEQYKGLANCQFSDIYYDPNTKQFGPGAVFFQENKNNLSVCWKGDGVTSFCFNKPLKYYGLDVKELDLPEKKGDYFGIVFFNDEEQVYDVLSKVFKTDIPDNENHLPAIWSLPEEGYGRIYCNLYGLLKE